MPSPPAAFMTPCEANGGRGNFYLPFSAKVLKLFMNKLLFFSRGGRKFYRKYVDEK